MNTKTGKSSRIGGYVCVCIHLVPGFGWGHYLCTECDPKSKSHPPTRFHGSQTRQGGKP